MSVKVGECHSAVLTNRGRMFMWGWNDKGQITEDTNGNIIEVMKQKRIVHTSLADDHTLALDDSGNVYTFGDNSRG
jgi:alpha-tubulin suppressor-like RCC1 family protein